MATTEQLTTWLAAAETAYHALMIGTQARVVVDSNSERVEYTTASAGRLAAYIADLKRQLDVDTPGPLRIWL